MSATEDPAAPVGRCGKWMPVSQAPCGRPAGHPGKCVTAQALANHGDNRPRKTARRRGVRAEDDPAVRARRRRKHKFVRLGITEEQFNALLEAQGYACGICREPFEDYQRICADHDHSCCPAQPRATAKTCGECLRGLLCVRCNTHLGWMERYGDMAKAYLAGGTRPAA